MRFFCIFIATVLLTSCMTSKPAKTYMLSPEVQNYPTQKPHIYLNTMILPAYLDNIHLMGRISDFEIKQFKYQQWAQSPRTMFKHTLAVMTAKASKDIEGEYTASVIFNNFEVCGKEFKVDAVCILRNGNGEKTTRFQKSFHWNGKDFEQLVALHEQALQQLAEEMVKLVN